MTQHLDLDALQAAAEAVLKHNEEIHLPEWFFRDAPIEAGPDGCDAALICVCKPTTILALVARLRKAEAASKWISVEKRLPEPGTTVLAFWMPSHGKVHGGCFATATYASPVHWHNPEDDEDDFAKPNFWMLIAAPTSADSEGEKG